MSTAEKANQLDDLSIVPGLRFLVNLPRETLDGFFRVLMECSDQIRHDVLRMFEIADDTSLSDTERLHALMTVLDQLRLIPDKEGRFGMDLAASEEQAAAKYPALADQVEKMNSQEAEFAERLRSLMKAKHITQKELAERVGCSQPAISQMLNRKCRPQRKTLEKMAVALNVDAKELWPDLEVVRRRLVFLFSDN